MLRSIDAGAGTVPLLVILIVIMPPVICSTSVSVRPVGSASEPDSANSSFSPPVIVTTSPGTSEDTVVSAADGGKINTPENGPPSGSSTQKSPWRVPNKSTAVTTTFWRFTAVPGAIDGFLHLLDRHEATAATAGVTAAIVIVAIAATREEDREQCDENRCFAHDSPTSE